MKLNLRDQNPEEASRLGAAIGLLPTTAQVLLSRGIRTETQARRFLEASLLQLDPPRDLPDIDAASARLARAITGKELIGLYADYDVDGLSGAAQGHLFLTALGSSVISEFPSRLVDGYGIHIDRLKRLRDRGASLVLAIDCGARDHEALALAQELRLDVIVVDHHGLDEKPLPVLAYINPLRINGPNRWKVLCSSGLIFYLIAATRAALKDQGHWNESKIPTLLPFLELATLGTVGDLVPLVGPNRILVRRGLTQLSQTRHPGLKALTALAGLEGNRLSASDAGFRLCPRINAAGRLGDPGVAFTLLRTRDTDEACRSAETLHALNRLRQDEERRATDEALRLADGKIKAKNPPILVLASGGWHPGVVGIVASKIVDATKRPTIVIALANGRGRGSGRSVAGIDLLELLKLSSGRLIKYGGHAAAIGLVIDAQNLASFEEDLIQTFQNLHPHYTFLEEISIDAVWDPTDDLMRLATELEKVGPFGQGCPEPNLLFRNLKVLDRRVVGQNHLRLKLSSHGKSFEAMGFDRAKGSETLPPSVDLVGTPEINQYNGLVYPRVIIRYL